MWFTRKLILKNLEKIRILVKYHIFFQLERLFENRHPRKMIGIYYKWQRGMMNIDRWISKWCHEITSISKCNETACQEKYVSLSNLYFFQEDCSSLSLVVRGSCLLIMQNWKISHFCGNSSQRENSFVRIDATLRQNTNSIYFQHKKNLISNSVYDAL